MAARKNVALNPSFELDNVRALPLDSVLTGDCIEQMAELPDKSVDVIFADPPYNLQLQKELWRPNLTLVDAVDDEWDKFENFQTYDDFSRRWLAECRRLLKDTGTIWVIGSYHNIYRVGAAMQDLGYWFLNDVSWIKANPLPNFRGVRFTNAHETLLWCKKSKEQKKYTFNYQQMKQLNDGKQMRSDWDLALCTGNERLKLNGQKLHSTQKPEALLYRVILASTRPGDVVLDPFFGTGTTGAVAKKLHRHWIGIERNPLYVRAAQERIEQIQQTHLDFEVFPIENKRSQARVPFASLLENGLLLPGERLYFARPGRERTIEPEGTTPSAILRVDGSLKCGELEGSIHQLGAALAGTPSCNGWDHWWYLDETATPRSIDELRRKLRTRHDPGPAEES